MKICFLIVIVLSIIGCSTTQTTLILDYSDFGPQAAAYELIGYEWWQWDSHGDSRPRHYDIKVVVYRDVPLSEVKRAYPVVKEKEQDYRYVPYGEAIEYLDNLIKENVLPEVTQTLRKTKSTIIEKLGKPTKPM